MTQKYEHKFKSKNNEDQEFILSFQVQPGKRMPIITNIEVYQLRSDLFCGVKRHDTAKHTIAHVKSMYGDFEFSIEIFVYPSGCEILVVETVIMVISHVETLQPCNITDLESIHSKI